MKTVNVLFVAIVSCCLLFTGCGGASLSVDTREFETAFSAAPADLKGSATQAASAIKTPDYATALEALGKVVRSGTLSDDQRQATSNLLIEMQKAAYQNEETISGEIVANLSDLIGTIQGNAPINR